MATFFPDPPVSGERLDQIALKVWPRQRNGCITVTTIHRYIGPGYRHDVHTDTVFFTCDDCGEAYPGPAYYTFGPEGCGTEISDQEWEQHDGCTGNLCPECACLSEPDYADDPRRPRA